MKLGAPPRELCIRGHTMAKTRKRYPNSEAYCSTCKQIRDKRYKQENPIRTALYLQTSHRRNRYGLEPVRFAELLLTQGNRCAICRTDDWGTRGPNIDHNHKDSTVRGLLCHRCNTALGLFRDNPTLLQAASQYLGQLDTARKSGAKTPKKQT